MDPVDIALLVLLVIAAVHGLRLGALVQVCTFAGFLLGLTVGAILAVTIEDSVGATKQPTWLTLAILMVPAVALGVAGRLLGSWSHVVVRRHHLGQIDSVLGVAVSVFAVLVSCWLVGSVLSDSRFVWVNSAVQRSAILRSVDNILPPVPSVFSRVQSFLDAEGFPAVFINLAAPNAANVAVPGQSTALKIGDPAVFSTVKVTGEACGYEQEGSGFVVGKGLVATNAHVVAGEPQTQVVVGGSTYGATPVLYDPSFDLAVLRTRAPLGPVLALDPQLVSRGTEGAVLGYPEDGPLVVGPAGVMDAVSAEGRDIYNNNLVTREVYEIDADIRPGNSGGPLVGPDGQVVGVVFSRSTDLTGVGYALASPAVLSRVDQAALSSRVVSTGACVPG